MGNRLNIIRIRAGMSDPKGKLIPRGVMEQITIEIAPEVATYYFKNRLTTEKFARIEIEGDKIKGIEQRTFFIERSGKAIRKYPGKTKEEIRDYILIQLKKLGAKAKILKDGK